MLCRLCLFRFSAFSAHTPAYLYISGVHRALKGKCTKCTKIHIDNQVVIEVNALSALTNALS